MGEPYCRVFLKLAQVAASKGTLRVWWVKEVTELFNPGLSGEWVILGLGGCFSVKQCRQSGEFTQPHEPRVLKCRCELLIGAHCVASGSFDLINLGCQQLLMEGKHSVAKVFGGGGGHWTQSRAETYGVRLSSDITSDPPQSGRISRSRPSGLRLWRINKYVSANDSTDFVNRVHHDDYSSHSAETNWRRKGRLHQRRCSEGA